MVTMLAAALVALYCHCHIAATIENEASKILPDELEDLTIDVWYFFQKSQRRQRQFVVLLSFVECKPYKLLKHVKHDGSALKLV